LKSLREEIKLGHEEADVLVELYMTRIDLKVDEESDELNVSFNNVPIDDLQGLIMKGSRSAYSGRNKTFLIVDPREKAIESFLSDPDFSYVILDARKMHLDKNVRKIDVKLILEEARRLLVQSMMKGKIFVVRLGALCVDFLNTFHDEAVLDLPRELPFERSLTGVSMSYLPKEFLLEGGDVIRSTQWTERLYRRKELSYEKGKKVNSIDADAKDFKCKERFRVVVVTQLLKSQLAANLFNGKLGLPDNTNFEILTIADNEVEDGL